MSGDLHRRIAVAAVGIPLCGVVVFAGGVLFAVGLGVLVAIGYREYAKMFRSGGERPFMWAGSIGAACFPITVLFFDLQGGAVLGALLLMFYAALATGKVPIDERPLRTAALTSFGVLYIGGLLSFGVPLREDPIVGRGMTTGEMVTDRLSATLFFFFPVVVTWLADTAAYFGGMAFGKHQLAPHVSPNKTREGAAAALLAAPVAALGYAWLVLPGSWQPEPLISAAFGIVVAVLAIGGDLVESAMKRECRVKDSSDLLPGHGGIFDRLDSLLWVMPGAYLFFALL